MITFTLITLLTTLTLLQCFRKWGWVDYYATVRKSWMPEASCYLCLGFWVSIIVAVLYHHAEVYSFGWLFVPFACAGAINILMTILSINENH